MDHGSLQTLSADRDAGLVSPYSTVKPVLDLDLVNKDARCRTKGTKLHVREAE